MKTIIEEKVIENRYFVNENTKVIKDENGKEKEIFIGKPELRKSTSIVGWKPICEYEGEPHYNKQVQHVKIFNYSIGSLNISDNETIDITDEIFRADKNEMHLRTNKVLKEIDYYKEFSKEKLQECIKRFNKEMINSNDRMKDYCELHNLNPSETDCIKLFNMIYPNREYDIVDGKMICKDKIKLIHDDYTDTLYEIV